MKQLTFLDLELRLYKLLDQRYELAFVLRDSAGALRRQVTLDRSDERLSFDDETLAELRALSADADLYGKRLGELLFAQPRAHAALSEALTEAQTRRVPLQLRLQLGPHSPLHGLRWEMLRDPVSGRRLATLKDVVFSRALTEGASYPRQLPQRSALRAVIAVANPHDVASYRMTPVDRPAEEERASAGFARLQLNSQATIVRATRAELSKALLGEPDIVYIVAHGWLSEDEDSTPRPVLLLEDTQGNAEPYPADDLVALVAGLSLKPALVILASCFSAGNVEDGVVTSALEQEHQLLAALAPRLAEAGVEIVIGARGLLSIESAQILFEELFRQLAQEGLVDRAFAAARARLWAEQRNDWWAPVLFMRQQSGRIWQAPQAGVSLGMLQHLLRGYTVIDPERLDFIADALNRCPCVTTLPLERYTAFDELFEAIHYFNAEVDAFAELETALNEMMPRSLPWREVAGLSRLVRAIRLDEHKLMALGAICSGSAAWTPPPVDLRDGLVPLARALALIAAPRPGNPSPLVTLADQLLQKFSDHPDVQQAAEGLREWRATVAKAHSLGETEQHPPSGRRRRAYLLIQVTPAVDGDKRAGAPIPEQGEALLERELFVEAWLFPEGEQPSLSNQVLPSEAERDEETLRPNFTVRRLKDDLTSIVQKVADAWPDVQLAVEILLPIELMLLDFDRWPMPSALSRFDDEVLTLGQSYPVAIRALDRFYGAYHRRLWPAWRERWAKLNPAAPLAGQVCWIASRKEADKLHLRGALVNNQEAAAVAQAVSLGELIETKPQLPLQLIDIALLAGVPAMFILRGPKGDAAAAKAALDTWLKRCSAQELLDRVYAWRNDPDNSLNADHYCHHLTLLWDDPGRCPPGRFEAPG